MDTSPSYYATIFAIGARCLVFPIDEGDLKDFLPQDLLHVHDDLGIMNILSDDFKEPPGEILYTDNLKLIKIYCS